MMLVKHFTVLHWQKMHMHKVLLEVVKTKIYIIYTQPNVHIQEFTDIVYIYICIYTYGYSRKIDYLHEMNVLANFKNLRCVYLDWNTDSDTGLDTVLHFKVGSNPETHPIIECLRLFIFL